ncbi:serine protease [Aminipila butyrica]|uniref:Serine protease n=1 Tax=Aminipila butyrica TaxID=433296 RepID=A0A858BYP0_9FIRM|nr:CAP domain-containing protein [Aminipila butyrica]QIB69186.1 serine protease [Aminipila butyrica]
MKTKFVKTTLSLSLLLLAAAPTAAFAGTNCNANVSVPLNQSVVKNFSSYLNGTGTQDAFKNLSGSGSNCYVQYVDGKLKLVSNNNGSQTQQKVQNSTNCKNGTDTKTNNGTKTDTDTKTNTGTKTDTDTKTNNGTKTDTDTKTNTGTKTDTDTKTNTGTNTNTNAAIGDYEQQVVNIVNQERAKEGLAPLTVNAKLSQVAEKKAEDMRDNNYFSHTSPTYGSPFDMMKQFGVTYTAAGENIAKGQKTPDSVMTAWMNSSGHRANIMNSTYQQIGVGYVTDSNGTTYWVQEFIK